MRLMSLTGSVGGSGGGADAIPIAAWRKGNPVGGGGVFELKFFGRADGRAAVDREGVAYP